MAESHQHQRQELGNPVDPIALVQRETDFEGGQFAALKAAIAKEQGEVKAAVVDVGQGVKEVADQPTGSVEIDPRLTTFKADFDADPTIGAKCSWTEIQTRLLANEGHYLALAQAMEQGGQLFGVDAQGQPLISDRGDEPVMKGMNYENTRDRVKWKHTSNDKKGKKILDDKQQPIATGYEMFGYNGPYEKSEEIRQYEMHTEKHFVQSPDRQNWRSSWLESGEKPSWPRSVSSDPRLAVSRVNFDLPGVEGVNRGVRRLLRVKKA